jgi:hypothetical protein
MKPIKLGKNQVLLPSGVVASKDGNYHYWQCSVSGLMTFAKPDYWVKVMAKFGSEENLVKTYVCKKAKALLELGKTPEQIQAILNSGEKLPSAKKHPKAPKAEKKPKKQKLANFAVKEKVMEVVAGVEVEVTKKTYPWTNDPNYFGSGQPGTVDFAADTETCHFPNRFLNDYCNGCPIYDKCAYKGKFAPDAHLDPKKTKKQVVTKVINPYSKEEIEAANAE